MTNLRVMTAAEQVAAHLRAEIAGGRLMGIMPGVLRLEAELGVNRNTLEAALRLLEEQGLLEAQGAGRRRLISKQPRLANTALRVAILTNVVEARRLDYIVKLQHELVEAGHAAFYSEKSLLELGEDVKRVARMVRRTDADAWVVMCGSKAVLEWFLGKGIPVFAMFGRRREFSIAGGGPDKPRAFREVVRHLVALGHRRIVLLAKATRRLPEPGLPERAFLTELAAQGIIIGSFNLPHWEETPEGLVQLIDSLFQTTPPTALLIDEAYLFHAVKHHLSRKGLRFPDDYSLICTDPDRSFDWCIPSIAHIRWDSDPLVRRILRWVENVARGKEDLRETITPAQFVAGGTVGPVTGE